MLPTLPPRSLRAHLLALWVLILASAAATAYLLYEFYTQSAAVQVAQSELQVARACREIGDRFAFFGTGWSGGVADPDETLKHQLTDVVVTALASHPGVEGGIWTAAGGSAAYAFPTYEGTGPKTDLPSAEIETIRRINAESLSAERPVAARRASRTQTLVVQGCPLRGPIQGRRPGPWRGSIPTRAEPTASCWPGSASWPPPCSARPCSSGGCSWCSAGASPGSKDNSGTKRTKASCPAWNRRACASSTGWWKH